jgi:DNA-binding LacI/PurR family transcriptional regulator
MFDRVTDEVLCDKVIINDKAAAYEAVQSLIDKGRKKIALFAFCDIRNFTDATEVIINSLKLTFRCCKKM